MMATVNGNEEALERVMARYWLKRPNTSSALTRLAEPFVTIEHDWGDAVLGTAPRQVQERGYSIELLRDGSRVGSSLLVKMNSKPSGNLDGAVLRQGEIITCERGFDSFWVQPNYYDGSTVSPSVATLTRLRITRDPYSHARAGRQTTSMLLLPGTAEPSTSTEGLLLGPSYDTVSIRLRNAVGTRLAAAVDAEIWWNFYAGSSGWAHNGADDLDAAGLGQAGPAHDCEVYQTHGLAWRVYVRDPSSAGFVAEVTAVGGGPNALR